MAKRSSAIKNTMNKNLKETSRKKVTTSKKTCSRRKKADKEDDDDDSLVILKDTKERTRLKGIDDKIKFLKSELISLMGKAETKQDFNEFKAKDNFVENPIVKKMENSKTDSDFKANREDVKKLQMYETTTFKPNCNSTPCKLPKSADQTKLEVVPRKISDNNSLIELKISSSNLPSANSTASCSAAFPQQEVEQLLYNSFLKQHMSKICQKPKGRAKRAKGQLKKFSKRRNRGTSSNRSFTQNNVEVVDLDSTSRTDVEHMDFDITELDWNEPFDLEDNSEVQIIENSGIANDSSHKKLKSSSPEQNKTASLDDSTLPKKVWECPVCFERSKGQEIVATQCGHVFCRKCLERHISKVNSNCPSCRCDIKNKPFITLFNM